MRVMKQDYLAVLSTFQNLRNANWSEVYDLNVVPMLWYWQSKGSTKVSEVATISMWQIEYDENSARFEFYNLWINNPMVNIYEYELDKYIVQGKPYIASPELLENLFWSVHRRLRTIDSQ